MSISRSRMIAGISRKKNYMKSQTHLINIAANRY